MSLFTSIKNFFSRIKSTPSQYETYVGTEGRTYTDVKRPLTAAESNSRIVHGNEPTTPRPMKAILTYEKDLLPPPYKAYVEDEDNGDERTINEHQDDNVRDTSHDDGQFGGGGASSSWDSSNDSGSSSSSDSGSSYDSDNNSSSSSD
jgi:hypothetical protein